MTKPDRVPRSAIAVLLLFTGITYFPVWGGKVPIPSDLLYYFVAYHDAAQIPSMEPVANVGDLVTSFYMFRTLAEQGASELELPIWNPYILSGSPFLGHSQSALFYPPNFVFYFLPLPIAWTAALLLRMFLAGLAMVLLIRALGGTTGGAVLAGVAYSACGAITAWQGFSRGDTGIWLPFVCYAVVRLRQSPSARNVALVGIAFAIPVFAGHPETAVHISMVGVLLALTLWLWPSRPTDSDIRPVGWNWILLFAAGGVLAVGISSIQLLPTVEFLRQMPGRFSMTWGGFPIDHVLGLVSRDTLRSPNSGGVPIPEGAAYVGMITLLLAALAPFYERKRYAIFFVTITLISFGVVYSVPPMPWLVAHTPFKVLKSIRVLLIMNFGLAALAGLGLSTIERHRSLFEVKRRRNLALLSFGVVFVATFLLVHTLKSTTPVRIEFLRRPSFSRALLFIAAVFVVLGVLGWLRGRALALAACALATFDLATFSQGFTGYALPDEIFPRISLFDFLQKQGKPDEFRIAQLDGAYPVNAPMHYGLSSADGYDLLTEKFQNFAADLGANPVALELTAAQTFKNRDRRLDLLNVKYFVVQDGHDAFRMISERPETYAKVFDNGRVSVFENKRALPRAFAVPASGIEVIENYPQNLNRVKDPTFNPEKMVVLSSMPAFPGFATQSSVTGGQSVITTEASDINGYQFRVRLAEPSVLVVSQISYPGWRARVDGTETAVYDADYALHGIPVPAGEHEVDVWLEPVSLKRGAFITSISMLVVGVLALKRHAVASNTIGS